MTPSHPFQFHLSPIPVRLNMIGVYTRRSDEFNGVVDSVWPWMPGNWATPLYAAQLSDQMVVPGSVCCRIIGSSVAASLRRTISI